MEWIAALGAGLVVGVAIGIAAADRINGPIAARADRDAVRELARTDPWGLAQAVGGALGERLEASDAEAFGAAWALSGAMRTAVDFHRQRIYAEEQRLVGDEATE